MWFNVLVISDLMCQKWYQGRGGIGVVCLACVMFLEQFLLPWLTEESLINARKEVWLAYGWIWGGIRGWEGGCKTLSSRILFSPLSHLAIVDCVRNFAIVKNKWIAAGVVGRTLYSYVFLHNLAIRNLASLKTVAQRCMACIRSPLSQRAEKFF